jgi:hypothetical protein
MCQMVMKYPECFQMAMKDINIFQSKAPPKFTQIVIFSSKRNHLATLTWSQSYDF